MDRIIEAVVPLFRNSKKFVLTTHVNPDGDGIGSEIALAEWLHAQGKQVSILNHNETPYVFRFLDPHRWIKRFDPACDADAIARADVIVVIDTNQPDRLRSLMQPVVSSGAVKVCIDHHPGMSPFALHYVIDEGATSAAEIIYRLLIELNPHAFSPLAAQGLYCAIMTDTGSFRYPRVDAEIHRIIAHLIECGADPVAIYSMVYERWSHGRIHLLGEMLAGLRIEEGGRLTHVTITQEMLARTGTTEEDTDNFTTYPMSVEGTVAGILFLELPGAVKISFRSRGDIAINELAKEFGGNGHKNAAGARIEKEPLAALKEKVLHAASKYVRP